MYKITILFIISLLFNFQPTNKTEKENIKPTKLTLKTANQLAELPLKCIEQEYPNKLGQVIKVETDLQTPKTLHPAFYGCLDWHSAIHGYWSLAKLLKKFPDLKKSESIKVLLLKRLSKENITQEIAYFNKKHNKTYERTYGWAWLLKLAAELQTWDNPLARELENKLQPLSDLIVKNT